MKALVLLLMVAQTGDLPRIPSYRRGLPTMTTKPSPACLCDYLWDPPKVKTPCCPADCRAFNGYPTCGGGDAGFPNS